MNLAILASFALVALAAHCSLADRESIVERPGYVYQHRKRLGHFKDKPYIDLYRTYAATFVQPNYKDRPDDDFRNFAPSVGECIEFLTDYQNQKYNIKRLDHFIVLDACLGYLYEFKDLSLDKTQGEVVKRVLAPFVGDEKLKSTYDGTTIDKLPDAAKECIANLMMSAVVLRNQFPNVRCNGEWLQLYLQFARCHLNIPQDLRPTDTYLGPFYKYIRDETHACFDEEKNALEAATRRYFERSYYTRAKNSLKGLWKKKSIAFQQNARMWPTPVVNLLKVVQNATREISLRQVHQNIAGYYNREPQLERVFLRNIAEHAQKVIKPKASDKTGDPTGAQRYRALVNNLCSFFRSADIEDGFDYATSFVRMVELLSHPDVFDLQFDRDFF